MNTTPAYRYEWTPESLALLRHWVPIEGCEKTGLRLGVNHSTVRKRVHKEGITIGRERTHYTPSMRSVIADLTKRRTPLEQIAKVVGVTLTSVTSHIRGKNRNRGNNVVAIVARPNFSKPEIERARITKERPCMGCARDFRSQGAHNRYCDPCRKSMSCDHSHSLAGARFA